MSFLEYNILLQKRNTFFLSVITGV